MRRGTSKCQFAQRSCTPEPEERCVGQKVGGRLLASWNGRSGRLCVEPFLLARLGCEVVQVSLPATSAVARNGFGRRLGLATHRGWPASSWPSRSARAGSPVARFLVSWRTSSSTRSERSPFRQLKTRPHTIWKPSISRVSCRPASLVRRP